MHTAAPTYATRRAELETYFDRTALHAWTQLTSDAPVSGIRATVRAGRERMRATLLEWLPAQLNGKTLFDAGCGSGALAADAARRGAQVIGVDVSASLIGIAQERLPAHLAPGGVEFVVGDMLDPRFGPTDFIVAMDSLIHYPLREILDVLAAFAGRANDAILFTFAPRTPALALMHAAGRLFPRSDRAPALEPVSEDAIRRGIAANAALSSWRVGDSQRIAHGFYTSHAMKLVRA